MHIACSCVCLAREIVKAEPSWNSILEIVYEIKFEEFDKSFEFVKK
jgi:hypothetical protein